MKKFYKNALITAGILFAVGAVILVICTFVGGSSFHNDVKSGNIPELVSLFHFNNSDTSHSAFHVDNRIVHFDFNDEYPVYSGSRTDNEAADASKIKHTPITTIRLNILEPTTLMTASTLLPVIEADTLTAVSGREVPIATMVSPMMMDGTCSLFATLELPSTKKSAPLISSTKPITRNTRTRANGALLISFSMFFSFA